MSLHNRTPEQKRLDENVIAPTAAQYATIASNAPALNQWKTSNDIQPDTVVSPLSPVEFIAGSTAAGMRPRTMVSEGQGKVWAAAQSPKVSWPPNIGATSSSYNFKLASYPLQSYTGAHLERRVITAGLGVIDPTQ